MSDLTARLVARDDTGKPSIVLVNDRAFVHGSLLDLASAENEYLRSEIKRLRATVGMVTRMKVMPDDRVNRITLAAAITMAKDVLSDEAKARNE